MGEPIIVYGKSGSGKTRSLKNFAEDEIYLINMNQKRLPFRKQFKYMSGCKDAEQIKAALHKMPVKTAVVDDAGYLMTNMFMRRHRGGNQFDLYNDIADSFNGLIDFIRYALPDDVIVYLLMHEERNDSGDVKLLTIGKLLDQKVCIEGKVTIVLRCLVKNGRHLFVTNSDGADIAKSPEEMFEMEIENDLKFVDTTVREFYGIETSEEIKEENNGN